MKSAQTSKDLIFHLFDNCFPLELLTHTNSQRRARIFSPIHTFVAYLFQILSKGSCRQAVCFLSNHLISHQLATPSQVNTSNYCRDRNLLHFNLLEEISSGLIARLLKYEARRIFLLDGTSLSMPDTPSNQEKYPQSQSQAEGIGFPLLKMAALYDVRSSAFVAYELGNKHDHEVVLARRLYSHLKQGDILVADRAFCSYWDMDMLDRKGVIYIIRNARYKHNIPHGFKEGNIILKKPQKHSESSMPGEEFRESIRLRLIKTEEYKMKGFRSESFLLLTNAHPELLDSKLICRFYRARWRIEMCFGSMKTQMKMEILTSKSVDMVHREIKMHQIAYNMIYMQIMKRHELPFEVSFKSVCTRLSQLTCHIYLSVSRLKINMEKLFSLISKDILYRRPQRYEPRVRKRRAKSIQLMTKPRSQYAWGEVIDHPLLACHWGHDTTFATFKSMPGKIRQTPRQSRAIPIP